MFKIGSLINGLAVPFEICVETVRGLKTKGEYFRRFGYKYTDTFKGGANKFF